MDQPNKLLWGGARDRLLGANTPWKRVRLTRGLGTRAASRAMSRKLGRVQMGAGR